MKDVAKFDSRKVLPLVVVMTLTVAVCIVLYAAVMIFKSDARKINAKRNEIVRLEDELKEAHLRFDALQRQYDVVSEELRRLEVLKAEENHKKDMYEPILKSAFKYVDSDLNYLTTSFVENVFTLSESKNVNPFIVFAIIDVESNFNSKAKRKNGAIGLGQIMPTTGAYIHKVLVKSSDKYVHESLQSPTLNVSYVIEYLSYLVRTRGSYDAALKLYCGGLVKGKEKFYPEYYRLRIMEALQSFGISKEQANKMLMSK